MARETYRKPHSRIAMDDNKRLNSTHNPHNNDLESSMENLRIASLANEIVRICENSSDIPQAAIVLAKEFQRRIHMAMAGETITKKSPASAPELWRSRRDRSESPPDFILRVYKSWLGNGICRADIKRLDVGLYNAFYSWKANGGHIPAEFDVLLPTQRSHIDKEIERAGLLTDNVSKDVREALRLSRSVVRRRKDLKT